MSKAHAIHRAAVWLAWTAAGLALACATPGIDFATGPGSTAPDGLRRVQWSDFGTEFLEPGLDLRGYTGILIDPLGISYQTQHGQGLDPDVSGYVPEPGELDAIGKIYQECFRRGLTGGGFTLASAPGPGVLRLSGRIVDLTLLAPPADAIPDDETVYSSTAGDLTLLLDLRDAKTGAPLMRTAGRHAVSLDPVAGGAEDNPVANSAALRELFEQQALLLHQRLEQLRTTPAPPAP